MAIKIFEGDCRIALRQIADATVQTCITSPPYYWQRDYAVPEQIGLEATPAAYVEELVRVAGEVRRTLADDGTFWLNIGDAYYSGNGQPCGHDPRSPSRDWMRVMKRPLDTPGWDIPKKSLLGIPWLVAHALQRDGWTVRQEIVWCRASAFAEPSVTDRPYRQHETIFLLSKSRRYFFDRSVLPEESVWHIPHRRGSDGHNAAFPYDIPERCIMASTRLGDTVLDPFCGSGTTLTVADRLGRHAIGIELNPSHADLSANQMPLFTERQNPVSPPAAA